jgi:excisionase family DNA binding protein
MIVLLEVHEQHELAATLVLGARARIEAGDHPSLAVNAFIRALQGVRGQRVDTSGQDDGDSCAVAHDGVMGINAVADVLGLSTKTVRRRVETGELEARRDGRRLIFERSAVDQYIDNLERT